MKVENLNGYVNQFLIIGNGNKIFQSYDSKIATFLVSGQLVLEGNMWACSKTTLRHFKAFINEETNFKYENKAQWLKEIENNSTIEVI